MTSEILLPKKKLISPDVIGNWSLEQLRRINSPLWNLAFQVDVTRPTFIAVPTKDSGVTAYFIPYLYAQARLKNYKTVVIIEPNNNIRHKTTRYKLNFMREADNQKDVPYCTWTSDRPKSKPLLVMSIEDAHQFFSTPLAIPNEVLLIFNNVHLLKDDPFLYRVINRQLHCICISKLFEPEWMKLGFDVFNGKMKSRLSQQVTNYQIKKE